LHSRRDGKASLAHGQGERTKIGGSLISALGNHRVTGQHGFSTGQRAKIGGSGQIFGRQGQASSVPLK